MHLKGGSNIKNIIKSVRKEKIVSNTILIYIKIKNIRKGGFWIWSVDLEKIKRFLNKALTIEIKQSLKKDNKLLKILNDVKELKTVNEAKRIISQINNFVDTNITINKKYKLYIYTKIEEAIKQVIKNNSNIYINLNKTFKEDDYCLKDY